MQRSSGVPVGLFSSYILQYLMLAKPVNIEISILHNLNAIVQTTLEAK